ncbi:MAG TPA: SRPBCC domain-containing protein [Nocardioidaceae bacterium]
MSVISVDKDFEKLTLTLVADLAAPPERVWELWADPRQLERWWGPPGYPATFEEHDLSPGGSVTYFMTGPDGEQYRGWWRVASINAPKSLEFSDGFADKDGIPTEDMPVTTIQMELMEHEGGTRMELRSVFDSKEQMEQLDGMGMTEGLSQAVGQMDALLTEDGR